MSTADRAMHTVDAVAGLFFGLFAGQGFSGEPAYRDEAALNPNIIINAEKVNVIEAAPKLQEAAPSDEAFYQAMAEQQHREEDSEQSGG